MTSPTQKPGGYSIGPQGATQLRSSTVEQIEEGAGLNRTYVIKSMKELDRVGFGEFVVGRRSKPSRMIWKVGLGDLGRCAQGSVVDFD